MRFALALLLLAAPLAAQHSEESAKGGVYADRLKDEIRARKMYEKAARAAIPPRFREAMAAFTPGANDLAASWGEFVSNGGTPFVALQLAVPPDVNAERLTFFGILGDDTYFEELPVQQSGDAFLVERSLLFRGKPASGTFGLARKNEILGMARVEVEPPSAVSRLILSGDVYLLPRAQDPLDPFAFGGTKVIPKPRGAFRRKDEVWIFLETRGDAPPELQMKVDIDGAAGGASKGTPAPAIATPLKGVPGHYGIGNTIDVTSLKPGDYRVRVTLTDARTKASVTREAALRIIESRPAARP